MKRILTLSCLILFLTACSLGSASTPRVDSPTQAISSTEVVAETATTTPLPPTETFTPIPPTLTPTETAIPTETPFPTVESLKATVTSDKIVCRYGPGANYLYLIAFNKNTPLRLIGRAPGNNWVLVENGRQDCWVNSEFIALKEAGSDLRALPSMYPDGFKIPVSPYYGPTTVLSAKRDGDNVTVTWKEIIVSPGKYEDANMFPYIVEVWHCMGGQFIFETIGSRVPFLTFPDEAGCSEPSHGRVYIQEKHGFAGPADIPWPER